jgi:hypothetical protein
MQLRQLILGVVAWLLALGPVAVAAQESLPATSVADLMRRLPRTHASAAQFGLPQQSVGLPQGGIASRYFRVVGSYDELALSVAELVRQFDIAYEYVGARVGIAPADATATPEIVILVEPPANAGMAFGCPQRGAAAANLITLYADAATDPSQLLGVLAHEVGHILMFGQLDGRNLLFGPMLPEGYATCAAGRYMTDWYGIDGLQQAVAGQLAQASYVSVRQPVGPHYLPPDAADGAALTDEQCFARRDHVYTAWGGFVEFLVERDGHAALLSLLRSGGAVGERPTLIVSLHETPAEVGAGFGTGVWAGPEIRLPSPSPSDYDYAAVYSRSAADLEAEWLQALRASAQ